MSNRWTGGSISAFQQLKAPNAPSLSASGGIATAEVTITAPANAGEGTISSYVVTAKKSDGSTVTTTTSSAGGVSIPISPGGTTSFAGQAFSEYGPGEFSGYGTSAEIYSGGNMYSWSVSTYGITAQNNAIVNSSPVQVGALSTWMSVSLAYSNNGGAVKTDNSLWIWGDSSYGALGNNSATSDKSSPIQVGALTSWSNIAVGNKNSTAVKTDGTIWCWGENSRGDLGQNNIINYSSPVQVGLDTDWSVVETVASGNARLALKTTGELYAWGKGYGGCLGQSSSIDYSSPVQVGLDTDWSSIGTGTYAAFAIKTNGTLWSWGFNDAGTLGQNNIINSSSPVQIGSDTDWSAVASSYYSTAARQLTIAVKTDGTIWSWGYNLGFGGLGLGDKINRSSPVQIGALTNWLDPSASRERGMAVKTDGTLWSWGYNLSGVLGLNNVTNYSSPVQVGAGTNWVQTALSQNGTAFGIEGVV
jgi:alpha-tubulin suppressor-like RCC1 family protein